MILFLSQRLLQAIIIEDPDIAQAIKQIFEIVWESRPEKVQGSEIESAA
ncbi:MAG: hypothetical protein Q7S18_00225 [bacterium]|nr:hypothetical protein [bacterium]